MYPGILSFAVFHLNFLRKMLEMGASKHWKYALKVLTGETSLNSNALFEYFKPLTKWLEKENLKAGVKINW